jgi:hypothetical protein
MAILALLGAAVTGLLSVYTVRQARRAWRNPGWEPDSLSQSARSAVPMAILAISFTVLLAGGAVAALTPKGAGEQLAGDVGVAVGMLGLFAALGTMATTRKFGRPRFMIPPPQRPGYAVPYGSGAPTMAELQADIATRALEAALRDPAGTASAWQDPGDVAEFIVIAGWGSHQTPGGRDAGRLVLTTHQLFLSTRQPNISGQRHWLVTNMRDVSAGPGDAGLTLHLADGRTEIFTLERHRDVWLNRVSRLLSLPRPITNWYGDPADAQTYHPAALPAGQALIVLWRAQGELRDRFSGYRVLIDNRRAAMIRRAQRIEFPISPGRHIIFLRSAWLGSRFVAFEAMAGQVLRFCCEPGGFPGMTEADMQGDVTGYIRLRRL